MIMKCSNCNKRRECAMHWAYITSKDGQELEGYDQDMFCAECSGKGLGWTLNYGQVLTKSGRFILIKQ